MDLEIQEGLTAINLIIIINRNIIGTILKIILSKISCRKNGECPKFVNWKNKDLKKYKLKWLIILFLNSVENILAEHETKHILLMITYQKRKHKYW